MRIPLLLLTAIVGMGGGALFAPLVHASAPSASQGLQCRA
jgi:hypothetical protein